jgi:hypothetical protein
MSLIHDGTYRDIILKDGKKVTLTICDDKILSPIKIINTDGSIQVISHEIIDCNENDSVINKIMIGIQVIKEISSDIYQRVKKVV